MKNNSMEEPRKNSEEVSFSDIKAVDQRKPMTLKNYYALFSFFASIFIGVIFTYLFCWKDVGISHLIFYIFFCIMAIVPVFIFEKEKIKSRISPVIILLPVILAISSVFLYRLEPNWLIIAFLTLPVLYGIVLSGTFIKSSVANFNIFSFLMIPILMFAAWFGDIVGFLRNARFSVLKSEKWRSITNRVLKGFIISLPFLFILGLLLTSADQVFNKKLAEFFDYIFGGIFKDREAFAEFIGKLAVGCIVSIYTMVFYFSLWNPDSFLATLLGRLKNFDMKEVSKKWDFLSSSVFMFSLNILFVAFVLVQFKYLFGGESNILTVDKGWSYAEYARKGFAELVVVAILSYLIMLVLNLKVLTKNVVQTVVYRANFLLLAVSILIVNYSAFARIVLYEQTYGFTITRIFVNLVLAFIAVMYLLLIVSNFVSKPLKFTNAVIVTLACLGYVIWIMTPHDFVVAKLNYLRYKDSGNVDLNYMMSQSDEAIPVLLEIVEDEKTSEVMRNLVMSELQIRWEDELKNSSADWQSFNFSRERNNELLKNALGKTDWISASEKDLDVFLSDYTRAIVSGQYKYAYENFWTGHSIPLDYKELDGIRILKYEAEDVYGRRDWDLEGAYWNGMYIAVYMEYEYKLDGNWIKVSRDDYLRVVLENGQWKIKDSSQMTLGNFRDGSLEKGILYERLDFPQNENFQHLKSVW